MDQKPKVKPGTLKRVFGKTQKEVIAAFNYSIDQEYEKVCALIDRDAKRVASEGYPSMVVWNRSWAGREEDPEFVVASEIMQRLADAGFIARYHHGGTINKKTIGVKILWKES